MSAGILTVFSIGICLINAASIGRIEDNARDGCDSEIYCDGPLLQTVQLSNIFNDSKTFVDLSQLNDPEVTLSNFNKLMRATNNKPNRAQVNRFVKDNFVMTDELRNWTLSDWTENPSILKRVQDPTARQWLKDLNQIWKKLARIVSKDVAANQKRHSLIYVPNGFIIPGGRFREFYYWDSYWVIGGLLLSDMYDTARGMIDNFLYMVDQYGFVPNGGRVYYLMRSQPPMLIPMFADYLKFTKDYNYLKTHIGTLEKEFTYWQNEKTVEVKKNGKSYRLARYVVKSPRPRPESYSEDYRLAQKLPKESQDNFYSNIKSAAESGWDFSNRWCIRDNKNGAVSLLNVSTENIIPVELNAILQRNARYLSEFHVILGNPAKAQYYKKISTAYQAGIDNVLWNEAKGTWLDYDMKNNKPQDEFYPTNVAPLYTGSYDATKTQFYATSSVKYLKANGIDTYQGGIPTSLLHTGEQWDFPNAWPPMQSFVIMGLHRTRVPEAVALSEKLLSTWLRANYLGYDEFGAMFEKYDAVVPGEGGGGGEYIVQEGFGWTNGIVFELFNLNPSFKLSQSQVRSI